MSEKKEIEKRIKEIETLKKSLRKKHKFFDLIRVGENEKAKNFLLTDNESFSYFCKFKHESLTRRVFDYHVIIMGVGKGFAIAYNSIYENEILEDFERLKREIEEKQNRFEQNIYIQKQQEYIEEQRRDIFESKKDRDQMKNFTFVLALGVLANIIFFVFQALIQFKMSPTLHILLISGISSLGLTLMLLFVLHSFDMKEKAKAFWSSSWPYLVFLIILILLFGSFLVFTKDRQVDLVEDKEVFLLGQTNKKISDTNDILNDSIVNQKSIGEKLDIIILNQVIYNSSS